MWVLMPVKAFKNAKLRLKSVLSPQQRADFSYLMLEDILHTLNTSDDVEGVTLISSDHSVQTLAVRYKAECLITDVDSGYSEDVMQGVKTISQNNVDTIAIIPADVPQLEHKDLTRMNRLHKEGLTLCPALVDGGTNGLLFNPPLSIPLMFGINSLRKYQDEADRHRMPVKIEKIASLERDIDRPADLFWLKNQASGGKAWSYIRDIEMIGK